MPVPHHWSDEDRELIESLPEDKQEAVISRMKAIEIGLTPKLQRLAYLEKRIGGPQNAIDKIAEIRHLAEDILDLVEDAEKASLRPLVGRVERASGHQ